MTDTEQVEADAVLESLSDQEEFWPYSGCVVCFGLTLFWDRTKGTLRCVRCGRSRQVVGQFNVSND